MFQTLLNVWESLKKLLMEIAVMILSLLPNSPFAPYLTESNPIKPYLGLINYFLPLTELVGILTVWLSAIAIYYCYKLIMKWVKLE